MRRPRTINRKFFTFIIMASSFWPQRSRTTKYMLPLLEKCVAPCITVITNNRVNVCQRSPVGVKRKGKSCFGFHYFVHSAQTVGMGLDGQEVQSKQEQGRHVSTRKLKFIPSPLKTRNEPIAFQCGPRQGNYLPWGVMIRSEIAVTVLW